jgi:hypothetical protein
VSGVANAIIAACGANCDHLEIALYDYQRKPLGRTPETHDRHRAIGLCEDPAMRAFLSVQLQQVR